MATREPGVRRGTDVAKALALGARACLSARPFVYALGAGVNRKCVGRQRGRGAPPHLRRYLHPRKHRGHPAALEDWYIFAELRWTVTSVTDTPA
ncbi:MULTISPECIES: alpha-hydroxy-acid oxidizing protein [Rhodococcus]|uniref:alpha-hydroxy-acid oxidizing protein n=1 Tax=Rhodococcus TaxID=1827 RepID=UPI0009D65A7D